tara:strand:+ start:143 stop:757 length:615 start_codon:yes stop_codon:yes gene_type:complete
MTGKIKLNAASGGGSVSLQAPSSSGNDRVYTVPDIGSDGTLATTATAGKILQVIHVNSNTHQSSTSTSYVDLSGMTATITPSSSSNKIFLIFNLAISKADNQSFLGRILRNGSVISGAGGVRVAGQNTQEEGVWLNVRTTIYDTQPSIIHYLDSPATTSAVTYKAQGKTTGSAALFTLNRTGSGVNYLFDSPTFSSITLMEIAS